MIWGGVHSGKAVIYQEDRSIKKIMKNRPGSTWRRDVNRWKRKENLDEEWSRLKVRDISRRIENDGWRRWRSGIEKKSTLKWYSRKQEDRVARRGLGKQIPVTV